MKKNNIAKDSIILTIIRVITLGTSMIQTMILSRMMTLNEYGTYSELLIIISLGSTISSLGLNNAINFFFNKEIDNNQKKKYIDTIFSITIIIGLIIALIIYCLKGQIAMYYNNKAIITLIIYIVIRPMFANIIALYQSLYISLGKTRLIATRNFLISIIQVFSIPITFVIFKNLQSVLTISILLDICQLIYFGFDFGKNIKINFLKIDIKNAKKVLIYAIPIALATMSATIFKESDKLIIANVATVEELAIYANMSRQLPFEFIVLCFTTVITPIIVRLINTNKKIAIELWKDYIEFGYISTWILCVGAIICAKELLELLYSQIYLSGLNIFIIYLAIELFRFTYFGLILSATGKTKYILYSSITAMIFNIIFNIIFYKIFGLIGPAIASLICTIAMTTIQLLLSCQEMNIKLFEAVRIKNMSKIIAKLLIVAVPIILIKNILKETINNYIINLIIFYIAFISIQLIINKKRLIYLLKNIGRVK